MRIGFDAKRIYQNNTGLGNYSRSLVASLSEFYPNNDYILFAPKQTNLFDASKYNNINSIFPTSFFHKKLSAAWRRKWVTKDINEQKIDVFHGLSFELPLGIEKTGIKTVATVHDLIFERYPHQYAKADVIIHRKKTKHACSIADKIIAVSTQTKQDLINFYNVPAEKIDVCYQSCNPAFAQTVSQEQKEKVRKQYHLPEKFFLNVGSIIERKNLLVICKAMANAGIEIPLVVIGGASAYKIEVEKYIHANNLTEKIIFLSNTPEAKASSSFADGTDFPAIFQLAEAMIYPSIFEGFGIPILEAMSGGTPVITTNVSCMPETAGDAALYIEPDSPETLAAHMKNILNNSLLAKELAEKGKQQAQKFSPQNCAAAIMNVYQKLNQ